MSPDVLRLPLIVKSVEMTDGDGFAFGADAAGAEAGALGALGAGAAALGACGVGADAGFFSGSLILLLENMTCGLDIVRWIFNGADDDAVQPDYIFQVDAGAAPRAAHIADTVIVFHPVADK